MANALRRVVISGGGSGGHVFPAIAIANAIRAKFPKVEILFVGAKGKIEMEKVPLAGYQIKGLWISGLQRSLTWKNVMFPIKLVSSLVAAYRILRSFGPQVVIGVGGFASGPTLYVAAKMGIPTLVQEQNSYPGLTNKWLSKLVRKVCVAYQGMDKYFDKEKIVLTGNPVRGDLQSGQDKSLARTHFGLREKCKTILIIGGSLGARTFNQVMDKGFAKISDAKDVQWIWQIGKIYESTYLQSETAKLDQVTANVFIDRMDLAYCAADLIICRAGALTISELCLLGKPAILVPSPNVAEDHQTINAQSLAQRNAAVIIADREASEKLLEQALQLIHDEVRMKQLGHEAKKMAEPQATDKIVKEVLAIANN